MIGSQSLVATVGHAITLHSLNFLTLGLLVLWALSPLGGQSALRLVHHTNSTSSRVGPIFYSNADAPSNMPSQSYNRDSISQAEAVLMASLMTRDTLEFTSADAWNHVKIPRVDALEQESTKNATQAKWYDVEIQPNQTYTALTGVDIMGLTNGAESNFTVPYEYMYFNCGLHPSTNATNNLKSLAFLNNLATQGNLEAGGQFYPNMTLQQFMGRGFFIWGTSNFTTVGKLIFGSQIFGNQLFLFECSLDSVLVEANIQCQSDTCETKRVRRLNTPRSERSGPGTLVSGLPYDVVRDRNTFKYFIGGLNGLGRNVTDTTPSPINQYLYGNEPWDVDVITNMPLRTNWTTYIEDPTKSVGLSQRMTKFLNTYWDATRWPQVITRNDPYLLSKATRNETTGQPYTKLRMNQTEATISHPVLIYKAEIGWVVTLVLCSTVLLLLGLVSFIMSLSISAPDIFDYISSFTRDNPYVNAPPGGSHLDGAERARLLRKVPIQLGDVRPQAETGYIALRSVDGGDGDAVLGRVKKGRLYE